jgi:superfamily II DNA or RNA helicase
MILRPWQEQALTTLREHNYNGVLKVASGQGKTVLAIAVLKDLLKKPTDKALVVVPTIHLMEQWIKEIHKFAPMLTTSKYFGGKKSRQGQVIVGVINSVCDSSWNEELFLVKVLDEIHHYGSQQFQSVFTITTPHTIGLSATPEREDEGDLAIRYGAGSVVYHLSTLEQLKEHFSMCTLRVPFTPEEYGRYVELRAEYKKLLVLGNIEPRIVVRRAKRGDRVALRILKLWSDQAKLRHNAHHKLGAIKLLLRAEEGQKIIMFSESISFAERVGELFGAIVVHSNMSKEQVMNNLEAFRNTSGAVLIAPRMIDEGYDVPDATVAIVASFTRSARQMIQRDGRVLRTKEPVRRYTLVLEGIEEDKYFSIIKKTSMDEFARTGLWLRYSQGFIDDTECKLLFENYVDDSQHYEEWVAQKLDHVQTLGKADSEFYEQHKQLIERLLQEQPNRWPVLSGSAPAKSIRYESEYDEEARRVLKQQVRQLHQRIILPEEFFNVLMRSIDSENFPIDKDTAEYITEISKENKLGIPTELYSLIRSLASVMKTYVLGGASVS